MPAESGSGHAPDTPAARRLDDETYRALQLLLQLDARDVARIRAAGRPPRRHPGLHGPSLDVGGSD